MGETLYTLPEVADKLKTSVQTLRKRIKEGKLTAHKYTRSYIVSQKDLDAMLTNTSTEKRVKKVDSKPTKKKPAKRKTVLKKSSKKSIKKSKSKNK